jgi:hypothetical protein
MTKKDQHLIWEAFHGMQPQEAQHGGPGPDVSPSDFDQSFGGEEVEDTVEDLLTDIVQSEMFEQFPEDIKARAYKLLR